VDGKGCVKVRTNCYSTPLKPGTRTQARLLPAYVEIWQERECVARHERSFSRYEQVLDLEHYGAETGRSGGIESAPAVARTRTMARELRPFVAELARTAWPI